MMVAFLLIIIAVLIFILLYTAKRLYKALTLVRKQHLQIIADAEFRGKMIRMSHGMKPISKYDIFRALKDSGINNQL